MNNETHKKIARRLFFLWVISYVVLGVLSNAYVLYQRVFVGYDPIHMLSGYQVFSLIIMIVYFIPLLLVVLHYAKISEMRKLCKITSVALGFTSIGTAIMLLFTIGSLFA